MRTPSSSCRRIGTASDGVSGSSEAVTPWIWEMRSAAARPAGPDHARSPARVCAAAVMALARSVSDVARSYGIELLKARANSPPRPLRTRLVSEMRVDPLQSRRRARTPQCKVEQADVVHPLPPRLPFAPDQRMLQQSHERDRREAFRGGRSNGQKQSAGRELRKRPARAVVGLDSPAAEQRGDTLSQQPVGSDQRRRSAWRLQCLPDGQGDGLRLRCGVGQLGRPNPGQPALGWLQRIPFVAEVGSSHCVGDRARSDRRRGRSA